MERLDKRPRVSDDAAEAIRSYIVEQRLQPGDVLPSERQIQEQLGISRSTVREALRVLQMMGVVEARHGKGLFVTEINLQPMVDAYVQTIQLLDEDAFNHLLEIRESLELGAVDLAAKSRTESDIVALGAVLEQSTLRVAEGKPALAEDLEFHNVLIRSTHNPLMERLYSCIAPFLIEVRERALDLPEEPPSEATIRTIWGEVHREHLAIFQAIVEQDREAVVRLMHLHLVGVRDQLQEVIAASFATKSPSSSNH